MKNGPYLMIVAPDGYPGKRYRGRYAYEHHVVWWKHTGEIVPFGHVIHHRDDDKHNNAISNLEIKTNSQHVSDHARAPRMVRLECSWCEEEFERRHAVWSSKVRAGQTQFFCCRSHQVKDQHRSRVAQ